MTKLFAGEARLREIVTRFGSFWHTPNTGDVRDFVAVNSTVNPHGARGSAIDVRVIESASRFVKTNNESTVQKETRRLEQESRLGGTRV